MARIENQPMGIIIEIKNAVPDVVKPDFVPERRATPFVVNPVLPPEREVFQPDPAKRPERVPTIPTKVPVHV